MIRRFVRAIFLTVLVLGFSTPAVLGQTGKPAEKNSAQTSAKPIEQKASPKTGGTARQEDLAAADLKAMKHSPLPPFRPQEPKRIQFSNGMVVFLQEDHELPLISGTAFIRGGATIEPADKVGLVSIYAQAWRTGGTKSKTGDQLDDLLEARAARVETGPGNVTTSVRLSCLKSDFDSVLDVFNDVLRNPEFRQEKIDLAKDNARAGIVRRNDNLGQIAARESNRIGYGADSPYARIPEYSTINAVTRQDLLNWHSTYVHPNNIILGIVGDFDSTKMEATLRKTFESWLAGQAYKAAQIPVAPPKAGIYFIQKDDVNQSEIRLVAPGARRDDPDYYAVEVLNEVFGGGFSSRLFSNLRTKAGLAYSVGGGIESPYDHPGLARLSIGTKSGTTAQAVEGLYREIDDMRTNPVSAAELQRARDAILNSFVFRFDSKDKVMQERMTYELYGYPADFLERYRKGVEAVTAGDVDRVARKYLVKDKFAVLVVGKASDFDKQLDTFGKVTSLDITIPQPGMNASAVAASSNPQGKALLAKVIEAAGGAERLNSIKTIRTKANMKTQQGMSIDAEETEMLPDKLRTTMNTPMGAMSIVVGPQESFVESPRGVQPIPGSQKEDQMNSLRRNVWSVAQHTNDPQYVFSAQGTEKVGDIDAAVLDIRAGTQQWRWYVDPKSGHIVRSQYQANGPTGPATRVTDFSEWKTVDGITLPYHEEITLNGQPSASIVISSYEVNPNVDAKLFEKPGAARAGDER